MASLWPGMVNTIVYSVQFDDLGEVTRDRIVRALLTEPIDTLTPEQEFEALSEGIRNNYPLPDVVETRYQPSEIRDFIAAVVEQMDAARPWPVLPYLPLPAEQLRGFLASARPIARVHLPFTEVETAMKRNFRGSPEFGEFLLLRMHSGIDAAFFANYWDDSSDTLLSATAVPFYAHDIVAELVAGSGLRSEDFSLTIWPEPPESGYPRTKPPRYEPNSTASTCRATRSGAVRSSII